jgi:hypothetical protein
LKKGLCDSRARSVPGTGAPAAFSMSKSSATHGRNGCARPENQEHGCKHDVVVTQRMRRFTWIPAGTTEASFIQPHGRRAWPPRRMKRHANFAGTLFPLRAVMKKLQCANQNWNGAVKLGVQTWSDGKWTAQTSSVTGWLVLF